MFRGDSTTTAVREIRAQGVWKCFRQGGDQVPVLEDVDLTVGHGEFVCVVGPSGCGKSTLLAILAGLEGATLGKVLLDGVPVRPGQAGQGFVFQQDLLLDWRTVLGNVLLGYSLRGEPTRPHVERARALLQQVGLPGTEQLYPWQLSGGMRQRVAICRALVDEPAVLFMDEPFGALDALTRERLNDDMIRLARRGDAATTVVFVTHDVAEAVFLGDRVVVMGSTPGRVVREIDIRLPSRRPDVRATPDFSRYTAEVREALHAPDASSGDGVPG